MVIAGRPLAAELVSAWSSCGSGLMRLVRAWASTLLACWSSPADDKAAILAARGFGIGFDRAFFIVYTNRDDGYTTLAFAGLLEGGLTNCYRFTQAWKRHNGSLC